MSRTIVITGSASGIGAATRALYEAQGDRVVGIDLADAEVEADLSTHEGRRTAVGRAIEVANGTVDVVVASAGISAPVGAACAINYFGATQVLDGLRESLARTGRGRAVVISSFSSLQPVHDDLVELMLAGDETGALALGDQLAADPRAGFLNYSSSKRAVSRWVRRTAILPGWAGSGIALNAVGPGVVVTPMTAELIEQQRPMLESVLPMVLGGFADAEAVARLVAFLASPENTHVTAQTIYVDGGAEAVLRGDDIWTGTPAALPKD